MNKYMVLVMVFISLYYSQRLFFKKKIQPNHLNQTTEDSVVEQRKNTKRIITLNAKNWSYDKKTIKLRKGENVVLKVNNLDGLHGIAIPELQIIGEKQIIVDTSKVGTFEFRCMYYCGDGHEDMIGKIIIE